MAATGLRLAPRHRRDGDALPHGPQGSVTWHRLLGGSAFSDEVLIQRMPDSATFEEVRLFSRVRPNQIKTCRWEEIMAHKSYKSCLFIICLFFLAEAFNDRAPAKAGEVEINGLPCNELCQAWMGYGKKNVVEPGIDIRRRATTPSVHDDRPVASKPISKVRRPELETVKTERAVPLDGRPALEPRRTVAAKHIRPRTREASSNGPVPTSRPMMPSGPSPMVADAPATLGPREPSRGAVEATGVPDTGAKPAVSIDRTRTARTDRPAAADNRELRTMPAQGTPPTAAAAPPPPPLRAPRAAAVAPAREAAKPSADTKAGPSRPTAVDDVARPGGEVAPALGPATAEPPTAVASLPSAVDAGRGPHDDDTPSRTAQDGVFQPIATPAGTSLPVMIGQISADPNGTNVHVIVINELQRDLKDVDVRCKARDSQGMQVAEASTRVVGIAPSDVAFGQVLFPSEITPRDNDFSCIVGQTAHSGDTAR